MSHKITSFYIDKIRIILRVLREITVDVRPTRICIGQGSLCTRAPTTRLIPGIGRDRHEQPRALS